jgi:hypothetical protein
MNPRVSKVCLLDNYKLRIEFKNGEQKVFDVSPYLKIGVFRELANKELFNTAKENLGSVTWQNGQDLCPDTLYLESTSS